MKMYTNFVVKVDGTIVDDYISFIWTDRYNTCGDFEMEIPFTAANESFYKMDQIVTCSLSDGRMIIETIKISISAEDGKKMIVSGRSYESILDRRVVAFTQVYDNNFFDDNKFYNAMSSIFNSCFVNGREQVLTTALPDPDRDDYKNIQIYNNRRKASIKLSVGSDPRSHIKNAQINIEPTGMSLLEMLETYCQAKDFGFKMLGNTCVIYDGAIKGTYFSMSKGNLISADYQASKENYKNAVYVQGDEYQANSNKVEIDGVIYYTDELEDGTALLLSPEATEQDPVYYRASVSMDNSSGLNRREMYIESSKNIGQNSNTKYVTRLEAEGRTELLKSHRLEEQASCEIQHDPNIKYGTQYSLGDIVTVSFDTIYNVFDKSGMKSGTKNIKMRVNEFTISHSESGLDLYPTFVIYDENKYVESNLSDLQSSSYDDAYDWDLDNDSLYNGYSKITFDFNGGKLSSSGSSIYYIPSSGSKKNFINGKYRPNIWYTLPESDTEGAIDIDSITGEFSFQQYGDFVTAPDNEPEKEHYIFQGWYEVSSNTLLAEHTSGDDSTGYLIATDEIVFKAKWEIEKYEITFDSGDNGRFLTTATNDDGNIVMTLPYGSYPSPPQVMANSGYHAANPQWSPEIESVKNDITYTAQWEENDVDEDEDLDPEDADYDNEDLPTDGTTSGSEDKRSTQKETAENSGESNNYYNLVHFRSYTSRVGDGYDCTKNDDGTIVLSRTSDGEYQAGEFYFQRDLGNGFKMTAHWFDPYNCNDHGVETPNNSLFGTGWHTSMFGIAMWKGDYPFALWMWSGGGGSEYTPEIAFTTVPEYEPYYEKKTLQWGYDNGEISLGALNIAPIFKPFKYYKYWKSKYWLLCVPPLDWLTNWGSYYYDHQAGYDVGFCCQFYDDAGTVLSPTWVRADGKNSLKITVNGKLASVPTELSYNEYYTHGSSIYWNAHEGPNTIYPPNSVRYESNSSSVKTVHLEDVWETSGWQYRRIPNERFDADGSELYKPDSVSNAINYSGELLIDGLATCEIRTTKGYYDYWYWYYTLGTIFGSGFYRYNTYVATYRDYRGDSTAYYWPVEDRFPLEGAGFIGDEDDPILHKLSGDSGLGVKVIEQINNVICKSKALSYFTYQVFLPVIAKIKTRKWYVSKDGSTWYVITGAEGNSLKVKTTDKTVNENEADGLTGADAIIGTDGSYYKSEVTYTDMSGNEFMTTSDIGQLSINDTDISSSGIEWDDTYLDTDGRTTSIDINDLISTDTDTLSVSDLNDSQLSDINNMFNSGSTTEQIAENTGIPKSVIDMVVKSLS